MNILNNLHEKSLIAPTGLKVNSDYLMIGDLYARNFLVTQLPPEFELGLMSYYISNPKVKIFMKTKPLAGDFTKFLKRENRSTEEELRKTTDPTLQTRLHQKLESLQKFINDIVYGNDRILDAVIVFQVIGESKEELDVSSSELKSILSTEGVRVSKVSFMQEELMRLTLPLFIDSKMDDTLVENYGIPITASNFAGMWPYNFQTLIDDNGFLLGKERNNGGMIKLNTCLYIDDPRAAGQSGRTAGNITIFGKVGSGKSTTMGLIILELIRRGATIVWTDPENRNRYLTRKYGGQFIAWGTKGSIINVFDLRPVSSDEGEETETWNTELAMMEAISMFKTFLSLYQPDLDKEVLNIVGQLMVRLYAERGISPDKPFRGRPVTDYPIMSDFLELVRLVRVETGDTREAHYISLLRQLENAILPMTVEDKHYIDGHTTVPDYDSETKIISFGTKALQGVQQGLKDALNFLMFRYTWSVCLDENSLSASIYDEGHEYILEGASAKELSSIARRSRKYKNLMIFGTQEPADLSSNVKVAGVEASVYGRAIMNNSTYKIIKMLDKDAREALNKLMDLNENELEVIGSFVQGEALLCLPDVRIPIQVLATERERMIIDPKGFF